MSKTEHPALNHPDTSGLGHIVGARYLIWTGDIDEVLGFDANGWVWVRDMATGEVRRHLTICSPEKRVCYHPRSCATCDKRGYPCGRHFVGRNGHEDCSGL